MKYAYDYICEPRNITIEAKSTPHNSKGINVTFYVDNKKVHTIYSNLNTYTPTEMEVNDHVARCCSRLKRLSEDKIQQECDENKIMLMLYVRKNLNKVEKRAGTCIWKS